MRRKRENVQMHTRRASEERVLCELGVHKVTHENENEKERGGEK